MFVSSIDSADLKDKVVGVLPSLFIFFIILLNIANKGNEDNIIQSRNI